jgi:DNA mismatch repair ATPase MutS
VGLVDMLYSVASLRTGLPYYCFPSPADPKCIDAVDMYHPLIENCVPNSFSNRMKSVILTGSNMSGKTAFIRTIAINVLTAQTIHICFAKSFQVNPTRLFSSIQISDDLINAKSYYLQEVLTVKEMIEATDQSVSSLFLLDELFKGTNTTERIAAGKAVLSTLNVNSNMVLIATHDLELVELLRNEFDLYHFSEQIDGSELTFDYKLKKGVMTHRNAIRILELYNYPPSTVAEAYATTVTLAKGQRSLDENEVVLAIKNKKS